MGYSYQVKDHYLAFNDNQDLPSLRQRWKDEGFWIDECGELDMIGRWIKSPDDGLEFLQKEAHAVADGSFLECEGEDGALWRWDFSGGKVVERDQDLVFRDPRTVRKFLDLSTSHLPEDIGRTGGDRQLSLIKGVVAYDLPYGWLLYVPEENDEMPRIPDEVQAVIERARSLGCDYVLIDRDGPVYGDLETFDW